jgi:two-component system, chemotaxis family, sensor kinase CheA
MDNPLAPQTAKAMNSKTLSPRQILGAYIVAGSVLLISLVCIWSYHAKSNQQSDYRKKLNNVIVGEQATTERVTKGLLSYQKDLLDSNTTSVTSSVAELKAISTNFDKVLAGLDKNGATVQDADGKDFKLETAENDEERSTLKKVIALWNPLFKNVKQAISTTSIGAEELNAVTATSREQDLPIYNLMGQLYSQADKIQTAKIDYLVNVRNFFIGLAGLSALILPAIYLFTRAAKQREVVQQTLTTLESTYGELSSLGFAKAETDRIMETVQEGLCLIDEKGTIGSYYSTELPKILRQEELAGLSMFGIFQRYLSEKMYNTTRDYVTLLFDPSRKEKTILKVNPLTDIEVNFPNPNGGFITRYLSFSFRRIMAEDKVDRLFIAVRDVTTQVQLENKLREAEKTKERELEILLSIIHVPHSDLKNFVNLAGSELDTINSALRAEDFAAAGGKQESLRSQLQTVFGSVHNLNGNAALLRLTYFQKAAHAFETQIKSLLERPALSGDDFLAIVVAQASLRSDLANLQDLSDKLKNIGGHTPEKSTAEQATAPAPVSVVSEQLRQLVTDTATDLGRSAELEIDEYALHAFSHGRQDLVRDVLVQLSRNAVAHGVEAASVREGKGKAGTAHLSIHALPSPEPGVIGLAFRDDGRGLDLARIQAQAEKVGLLEPGKAISNPEIINCIFEPSFSTVDEADLHSGRGVGMSIVKSKIVDTAGGCIEIISEPDQFCEFRIYLPA